MMFTDDPVRDYDAYCEENDKWLERRPICSICEEHIGDDTAFRVDGEWICEDCMDGMREEMSCYDD